MLPRWVWDYIRTMNHGVHGNYYEIRGWNQEYISQKYKSRPSISDISSPCPSKRDVWIRKVLKTSIESKTLKIGRSVHKVFMEGFRIGYNSHDMEEAIYAKKKIIRRELNEIGDNSFYKTLSKIYDYGFEHGLIASRESIPVTIEPIIPGALIGLSDYIRPDFMVGFIPVELTTMNNDYIWWKKLAVTGYALAIEAWAGNPVDYAVILQLSINGNPDLKYKVVRIDDHLRKKFIEIRDEIARMLDYGEEPEIPVNCPRNCTYKEICLGRLK